MSVASVPQLLQEARPSASAINIAREEILRRFERMGSVAEVRGLVERFVYALDLSGMRAPPPETP